MLLGRERERRAIDELLAGAREGRSGVLALVGEPGIGKSALLEHAASAEGMRILRARGVESEAHVPFAGLLELVRPALGALDRVPRPQAAALERALALRPGPAQDRFATGAATLSLLAAFAEEAPLLVLVDDAHSLDGPSADALRFAVRRLVADPIAVVIAVRDGEPSLLDGSDLPTLRIEGLDRDAARELLATVPAAAVERLFVATAGNPLALLELAADAETLAAAPPEQPLPLSTSIARAFLRRSAALPSETQRALLLAAAGEGADLALLTRAGVDAAELADAERVGLVRLARGRVEFRHPLVRSAIYGEAGMDDRREAHRALASALPDREVDRRAWHLAAAAAGADEAASAALEQAGRRASERTAYSVASAAFERAARLSTDDARRGGLFYEAADAAWLGGAASRARALLDEAALIVPDARIDALRGEIAVRRGPVMEGYELLRSAAERAQPAEAVLMLAEAADACFYSGATAEMLATGDRAAALVADGANGAAPFYAAAVRGQARVLAGLEGADDIRRAVELFRAGDFGDDPRILAFAALAPLFLREADAGRDLMNRAIATAREHAAVGVLPRLLNRVGREQAATDRWREAHATYDEAIRLARETGQRTELAAALAGLAWLEARQGREQDCRAHAAEAQELCRALGVGFFELWTYTALGELELALGRAQPAADHFETHEARAREIGLDDVDMSTEPELVDLYSRLGRVEDAAAVAARYDERAHAKRQPWALARAARCRGIVSDDFDREFEEALTLHGETADVFETASTQLAYGSRLRRARRRVEAREQLRAAIAAFDRLGPTPWADTARAELAATGETARRRDPSTLDDLTPQELQIARLLAGGMTTREAAAALFLSPKTIEYHLRAIYRKLSVNSRPALAEALAAARAR